MSILLNNSKIREVFYEDDMNQAIIIIPFTILKFIGTAFLPLLLYIFPKLHAWYKTGVQINILMACAQAYVFKQVNNMALGLLVAILLELCKTRQRLLGWFLFYSMWNMMFVFNNDNILHGLSHNLLPIYHVLCMTEKGAYETLKKWTVVRAICLSFYILVRHAIYIQTCMITNRSLVPLLRFDHMGIFG